MTDVAPSAQQQQAGVPPVINNDQLGQVFSLFNKQPAVPSSDLLIALRLLRDADTDTFAEIAKDELRWLKAGMALVKQDPFLRIKLGGDNLSSAVTLAGILRGKAESQHIERRLNTTVDQLINREFTGSMERVRPLKNPALARDPVMDAPWVAGGAWAEPPVKWDKGGNQLKFNLAGVFPGSALI